MNPAPSDYSNPNLIEDRSRASSELDLSSHSISNFMNHATQSKDCSSSGSIPVRIDCSGAEDEEDFDSSEFDISHEEGAERKIVKIDKKLNQFKAMDKAEKRRLQNRKSALKCRLRKTATIQSQGVTIKTLQEEVHKLKSQRQSLQSEISKIKDQLKDEKLKNAQLLTQIPQHAQPVMPVAHIQPMPAQYIQAQPAYYPQGYPMQPVQYAAQPTSYPTVDQRYLMQPIHPIQAMQPVIQPQQAGLKATPYVQQVYIKVPQMQPTQQVAQTYAGVPTTAPYGYNQTMMKTPASTIATVY